MLLKDRVALITGASRGIGAATARLFGRHGAAVAVNYVANEEAADGVVRDVEEAGGRAVAVRADVRERDQVERMVALVREALGEIDTLVVNAGWRFKIAPFLDYEWEEFEPKLVGELRAAFFCVKAVVDPMVAAKRGSIVMVSSGLSRHPGEGFCAHSTSKSALDAFAKSLAFELGPHGIRVNVVAPGLTITDATAFIPEEQKQMMANLTPLRRNALPEDVAGAVLLMASEEARFLTGAYVPVSGGFQML
jgi:3-oxoacyl-[acyl-carrier protein] reductase